MATKPRPWPTKARWARDDAQQAARDANTLLALAEKNLELAEKVARDNPELVELAVARALTKIAKVKELQEKIQRVLEETKNGDAVEA